MAVAFAVVPRTHILTFHVARIWGKICVWATGCPTSIEGLDRIDLSARYVIMSNHQSALDIPVLIGALPAEWRTVFWAKKSLFKTPFLGWAMRALGHLPVDRINRDTAASPASETAGRGRPTPRRCSFSPRRPTDRATPCCHFGAVGSCLPSRLACRSSRWEFRAPGHCCRRTAACCLLPTSSSASGSRSRPPGSTISYREVLTVRTREAVAELAKQKPAAHNEHRL